MTKHLFEIFMSEQKLAGTFTLERPQALGYEAVIVSFCSHPLVLYPQKHLLGFLCESGPSMVKPNMDKIGTVDLMMLLRVRLLQLPCGQG